MNITFVLLLATGWPTSIHLAHKFVFFFFKQMTISQNGAKKKRTANLNSFYCEKMSPFRPFIIRGFSSAKSYFRLESCRSEIHKLQTVVKDTRKLEF